MHRKTVILITKEDQREVWGSLTRACKERGWSYHTVSRKKLPNEFKGWRIDRLPFNT
jgi:hypothetical protein